MFSTPGNTISMLGDISITPKHVQYTGMSRVYQEITRRMLGDTMTAPEVFSTKGFPYRIYGFIKVTGDSFIIHKLEYY